MKVVVSNVSKVFDVANKLRFGRLLVYGIDKIRLGLGYKKTLLHMNFCS